MATDSAVSTGNGAAKPNGKGKPKRRDFDDAAKKAAVARVAKGESVKEVAASIPVVNSVLRGWMARAGVVTARQKTQSPKPKKPPRIGKHPEAFQRAAAQRYLDGEAVLSIAEDVGVSDASVREWAKKFPTGNTATRKKGERQTVNAAVLPMIKLRDAAGYLKHAKDEAYAQLHAGKIKEFEAYHEWLFQALRLLHEALATLPR